MVGNVVSQRHGVDVASQDHTGIFAPVGARAYGIAIAHYLDFFAVEAAQGSFYYIGNRLLIMRGARDVYERFGQFDWGGKKI